MQSNFSFLQDKFPVLANFGAMAERYCYSDANSCLMKLGMIGETIVNLIFSYDRLPLPRDNRADERIKVLLREGLITSDLSDVLHALRKARNKAVHENYESVGDCRALLPMAYSLSEWFMQTYGDWDYESRPYQLPSEGAVLAEVKEGQEEKMLAEAEQAAAAAPAVEPEKRRRQAQRAAGLRQRTEAETRYLIDEQLRQVGWEADTERLRYSRGTRPQKGRNLAIAEWPTSSAVGQKGFADYALFVGEKLVAIIEAKAMYKDIPSVLDYQCKDYARHIRKEDAEYLLGTWGKNQVPFVFATNGREYLPQLDTKSGIWFLDLRQGDSVPKAQRGWMSPEGLMELFQKDTAAGDRGLRETPYDVLQDPKGLNLRPYQLQAIKAAEEAVLSGRQNILLAMATGTGKTRTVLGLIYRFLKTGRFRRILFLVDRSDLGDQAQDVFKEVKLEELMTLDDIYNIQGLEERDLQRETRLQVATVQSMVKRVLYHGEERRPAITDFDLIIIDEAHRGYILDREMGEDELLYRDQLDYQSKYRNVVEYFDAVRIALTATPALHTTEIFGEPVYQYSYREAVMDGFLVDHDAPHLLTTKLGSEGIHYSAGDTMALYDPVTGELTNSPVLADELDFDIEKFNRQVITENFNRAVLKEISRYIDPENPEQGKTLIYAVNDQHADLIVKILKEIYGAMGVDNDAIMKITGSVGGGNRKKIREAIKHFKNERYPSIVVTVDLLTTGIDVPEITALVFLRRVKSRILYEQMLGRATRLCLAIGKTHFEIYDPVGLYESLEPVTSMKPVVVNPAVSLTELLQGLEHIEEEAALRRQIDQIAARVQRKNKRLSEDTCAHFQSLAGGRTPTEVLAEIRRAAPREARAKLLSYGEALGLLDKAAYGTRQPLIISAHEDELLSHTRGYGSGSRPEDYLEAFAAFIRENMDKIAALTLVCTRPRELTRESLKNLRLALDRAGFTDTQLNTALTEMTSEDIAADIITLIRRYAIGSHLLSHEERIKGAVARLKKAHSFSAQELSWLKRMEKYLLEESVLTVQAFDEDSRFRAQGGFARIDKIFAGQLEKIIAELNEYLYDDGGSAA
ncbi:type I restriction-modification system endonuclease [Selenomonas sp. AB3002]|uniref:type I restriction-modification system endonuclease n=1 Tax=Selenomonas sp. AB3002 TaxID=1392502 RepID=UPI000497DE10